MTIARAGSTLLIAATLLLSSCGGGGGGGAPPITNNLSATALQVVTPAPRIAYPLKVSVSITADEATDNVSVSLFAVEDNQNPAAVTRQIPLGTQTISRVEAGAHSYELEMNIPSSVEVPGSYFIGAIVDPVNEIAETDEDDNTASIEATLAAEETPNIFLKEVALDRTVLDIDTSTYAQQVPGTAGDVHNADAGGTITVGADGLGVNQTIDLQAFAKLRLMRSDTGTSFDVPLYLWDSDAGRYTHAFGVDPAAPQSSVPVEWLPIGQFKPQLVETAGEDVTINDVNRDSTHLNFYFPGKLGSELEIAMRHLFVTLSDPSFPPPDLSPGAISAIRSFLRNLPGPTQDFAAVPEAMSVMSFAICVDIRPADPAVVDRSPDDNEICSPLTIMLPPRGSSPPPPPPLPAGFTPQFSHSALPLKADDGFGTKGGGSAFAFGFDFDATATGDHHGYVEEISGSVPVTIFGANAEFMSVISRAQLVPDYAGKPADDNSGFTMELRFAGVLLTTLDLPPNSLPTASVSFSKELPQPPKEFNAFVGPVPVTGGGSVAGNLGIEYQLNFTADPTALSPAKGYTLSDSVSPFVNAEASLFAGIGNSAFSVGVEGVLTLLDERLTLSSGTDIEVFDRGFQSGIAEFVISQGPEIDNDFTGPKGALNLYAKYSVPTVKKCKWGFFTGLCPTIATIKATKEIWSSKALFHLKDILLERNAVQLDVVVAQGQPPAYFAP
jgi:CARDB